MLNAKTLVSLACLAACIGASAQQTAPTVVGRTAQVQGLVTVSFGAEVANVVDGSQILDRSRYVTSSSGRVLLKFKDGCDVQLEPNQWIEVDNGSTCAARVAAVQAAGDATATAGIGPGTGARVIGVGLLVGAGAAAVGKSNGRVPPASAGTGGGTGGTPGGGTGGAPGGGSGGNPGGGTGGTPGGGGVIPLPPSPLTP